MEKTIITSPFILRHWLFGGEKVPLVCSLDCETTSLKYLELDIIGFSLCDGKRACYVNVQSKYRQKLLDILSFYLNEYDPLVIMHNSAYDICVLRKVGVL